MDRELADKQSIYELMCRYCSAVDRQQFDRLRALFLPAATIDFGAMFRGDTESFIAMLQQKMPQMKTQHMIGNHLYHVEGDTAEGEIYTVNHHIIHGPQGDEEYVAGGRYIDNYVRSEGRWRISHRLRLIDWSRTGPVPGGEVVLETAEMQTRALSLLPRLYRDR